MDTTIAVHQVALAALFGFCAACSDSDGTASTPGQNDASSDTGQDVIAMDGRVPDAHSEAAPDASADASPDIITVPDCDFDSPNPPPSSVLWPAMLSASGSGTLGGHGHDDGKGPIGFCQGTPVAGQPFYRLIAVGFESDTDVTGDGKQDDPLPVDFWKNSANFTGLGESQGRINVYIEIVDASDKVLNVLSHPNIRIKRTIKDGPTDLMPLTDKPVNEFQTNFPMSGGARYGVELEGASDRVINMRLPVNHHVTFTLVFRREG